MIMNESAINTAVTEEQLENIFRRLLDLYERHTQERQIFIKEKEELTNLIQLLVNQTKEIGKYETGIRKRIQDEIRNAASTAAIDFDTKANEKLNQIIHKLKNDIEVIISNNFHIKKIDLFTGGLLFFLGMIIGMLFIWLLLIKG